MCNHPFHLGMDVCDLIVSYWVSREQPVHDSDNKMKAGLNPRPADRSQCFATLREQRQAK